MANATAQPTPPNIISDWRPEFNKITAKYLYSGGIIAFVIEALFIYFDYVKVPELWQQFLVIRIAVLSLLLAGLLYKPLLRDHPAVTGFIIFTAIVIQDAYFFSFAVHDTIHTAALSYMIDFVGGSMILLWTPWMAIAFLCILVFVSFIFFAIFSVIPAWQFMSEGGLLVLAGAVFCMAMVVFRYHSVKAMLISKLELIRSNEWMMVQNEIIEEKSVQLQRSNNRLKEFAYIVSHDLKTPLRGIRNLAMWIKEDHEASLHPETISHLKMIDKQIMKMENLIKSVLDYSKSGYINSKTEWINLDEMINDQIETVNIDNRANFHIKTEVPRIKGTRLVLNQVLQNLISNSIKHNDKPDKEVEISVKEQVDSYLFSVSDNGPGIDVKDQPKIFELFRTLRDDNNYECTGIGLPVAKKMIEEAGGEMWLESVPGEGTSFYFSVPKID